MTIWKDEPPTEPGENRFYVRNRHTGRIDAAECYQAIWLPNGAYRMDGDHLSCFQFCHTPIPGPEQLVEMERKAKMLDWILQRRPEFCQFDDGRWSVVLGETFRFGATPLEAIQAAMLAEGVTL